jgi:hypothetical protein
MRGKAVRTNRSVKLPVSPSQVETKEALPRGIFFALSAAIAAGVFLLYSPSLHFQFILDDHHFMNDPRIQNAGHVWEYFTNYVWAQITGAPASFYRPFFILWLRLNFILSGMSPWGWHLLSIVKHLAAAGLLGLLTWKLLRNRMAALVAASLFALHPAQVESVAWVTVPDPLTTIAILSSILFFLIYAEHVSGSEFPSAKNNQRKKAVAASSPSIKWLIFAVLGCLTALFTKETAIVLPVLLFAFVFILPGEFQEKSEHLPKRLFLALRDSFLFLVVTAIYFLFRLIALDGKLSSDTQHLAWKTVMLSWPKTLWFYMKVLIWPVKSRAFSNSSLISSFSFRHVLLPLFEVICVLIIFVAGFAWAWKKSREHPEPERKGLKRALVLGALLFLLPFPLTLNLNALEPGDFLHGRYMYLPLCGLALLLATVWDLSGKAQMPLLGLVAVIVLGFGILTAQQEGMWKDDLTLFTAVNKISPRNAPIAEDLSRAHVQVALGLDDEDRCDEAMPIFNQAIQQYPKDWFAWAGRGECLYKLNDLRGSKESLERAYALSKEPRVHDEWQMVREKMDGAAPAR